jgi:hypothetical protein
MAFRQEITDRCKAKGFYKYVEWKARTGVLVKLYHRKTGDISQKVSFETGVFDLEYDQNLPEYRQFYLSRRDAVKFMLNSRFTVNEIKSTFQLIDNGVVCTKQVY